MEEAVQLLLQGGALGLLGYLIWWTTKEGAPQLFARLGGIQEAILTNNHRLQNVEHALEELKRKLKLGDGQ